MTTLRTRATAPAAADLDVRQDRPDSVHRIRVAARRLRGFVLRFAVLAEEAGARVRRALDSRRYVQLLDVLEVVLSEQPPA
ncbi:MAG: hypothetical protein QOI78_3076 [Actinomycetota bacterium]|jgi:CHAD domain-containing protein|nr:hypothetical protein [Actinomycetota bacterium]